MTHGRSGSVTDPSGLKAQRQSRRAGLLAALLAGLGAAIAAYLTLMKLAGELPACGPLHGCETVATSSYSEVVGIPVAVFGLALSLAIASVQIAWWRTGDRRAIVAAYGLGLAGVVVVGYLTFLELFVIHAVCVWCVGYAVLVVTGWIVAAVSMQRG